MSVTKPYWYSRFARASMLLIVLSIALLGRRGAPPSIQPHPSARHPIETVRRGRAPAR
jgi:hypothetical protein